MRYILALVTALTLLPAHAQRIQSQAELDALLAPIALQPDPVLSEILTASARVANGEPWDSSVQSLQAYPELLARMAESPQWVRDLGEAFITQEPQVMDTVQALRRRAQSGGYLASTPEQNVYQQGDAIVVYPRTQYVYVPYYDPYVVYGTWWWPHYRPIYWRPWAPHAVFVAHFHSRPHWQRRHVHHYHQPRQFHNPPRQFNRPPDIKRPQVAQVQSMPAANAFSQQRRDIQVNTIKHAPNLQHAPRVQQNARGGGKQQAQRR